MAKHNSESLLALLNVPSLPCCHFASFIMSDTGNIAIQMHNTINNVVYYYT